MSKDQFRQVQMGSLARVNSFSAVHRTAVGLLDKQVSVIQSHYAAPGICPADPFFTAPFDSEIPWLPVGYFQGAPLGAVPSFRFG
jgi:hypothetical protein